MNTEKSAVQMDAALANKLLDEYGALVVSCVPKGTEFGIDLCQYTTGENFRGVKMIPPGFHYIWCASQGPYGDSAPRVGFVHYFKPKEIVVREWNAADEELCERQTNDAELEKTRIRQHLRDIDSYLAPYELKYLAEWHKHTRLVTAAIVERCRPALGTIRTSAELQSCPDSERPRGAPNPIQLRNPKVILDENDLLPEMKPIEGTAPRFTMLPTRVPQDATPAEVSRHSMDCVEAIDALLEQIGNANELLSEMQLSFVFFLVGHSVEALAQWRKILHLLANSENAVGKHKSLYLEYSELLGHQLPRLPMELMEPTEHNTVHKDVRSLLVNLSLAGLNVCAERLKRTLFRSLHWEFTGLLDEDPEDMPVIVEDA